MHCPSCGKETPSDARFCPSCGRDLSPSYGVPTLPFRRQSSRNQDSVILKPGGSDGIGFPTNPSYQDTTNRNIERRPPDGKGAYLSRKGAFLVAILGLLFSGTFFGTLPPWWGYLIPMAVYGLFGSLLTYGAKWRRVAVGTIIGAVIATFFIPSYYVVLLPFYTNLSAWAFVGLCGALGSISPRLLDRLNI